MRGLVLLGRRRVVPPPSRMLKLTQIVAIGIVRSTILEQPPARVPEENRANTQLPCQQKQERKHIIPM